ncbi:cerebellin-2-like [Colossoma macropomum]|uniref:cerebellin-2-like n=1 Tax=Colossoma macropomum TaxID=42526 RepID=UPI0018650303|nr:cerebellin-2-like [Colossoma macropomum]
MMVKVVLQGAAVLAWLLSPAALGVVSGRNVRAAADDDVEVLTEALMDVFKQLKSVKTQLENLKTENKALKTELGVYVSKQQSVLQQVQGIQQHSSDLDSKIASAASKQDLHSVEQQVDGLKTKGDEPKVSFSATLSNLESGQKFIGWNDVFNLPYINAFTNIGNAYCPSSGIFTAPVKGVYFFSFTVFNTYDNSSSASQVGTGVALLKNGVHVLSVTDNPPGTDTEDTGAGSACLLLNKGDEVYLRLWENCRVYTDGNKRNTFSGHLVFAM